MAVSQRAGGQAPGARALWSVAPGQAELRPAREGTGPLHLTALYSGLSRGTERLVLSGRVPASEYDRMRGPGMEGQFPFPVKYGYALVARVTDTGVDGQALKGRMVFCLHPHQDRLRVPEDAVHFLPETLPPERAVLAANMETALNILWDAGVQPGDRVNVFGAGVVGLLVAHLAAAIPGTELVLLDPSAGRAAVAEALGLRFGPPEAAARGADVQINCSGAGAALVQALDRAGPQSRIIEASWYGEGETGLPLGGAFHAGRLSILSSQVGSIPPARAPRWDYRRRMAKALELLAAEPLLDALISGETDFADLAAAYPRILDDPNTLCHRVKY